ncbi:hypothetical protein OG462_32860 [Streptomyces sp. NBC_01077]|uniref:hypothetical protein n=1 Tax=Streptomyces sp. NBC_01077 TaxID=2903746 RepID=UPI00386AA8B4|nr:hypothetical protein OG462_32860 [Streptomyces sp. NBC_01077]
MHLIHVGLCGPVHAEPAREMAREILAAAEPVEGVEHVVVHHVSYREAVVGLFLRVESLAVAEETAAAVCARALSRHPGWGYAAVSCDAVLVWPLLDP